MNVACPAGSEPDSSRHMPPMRPPAFRRLRGRVIRAALAAGMLLAAALSAGVPAEEARGTGTFAHVSDIHFNPFVPEAGAPALVSAPLSDWQARFAADPDRRLSRWGDDTTAALLDSALDELTRSAQDVDFVVLTGDLLAHHFAAKTERVLGLPPGSPASRAFAAKTTLYVARRLRAALPDKPVFLSLGNTDSGCGDYGLAPDGPYLQATREEVRALAGSGRVAADFEASYLAGGYFAAAHPTQPDTTLLVLNDVLWSTEYRESCGTDGPEAGTAMMDWLAAQLAAAEAAGRKVWLLSHIPSGIDAYTTLKTLRRSGGADGEDAAARCRAAIVPMLVEPFAGRLAALRARYAATVTASFSGHDHHDDYRLLRDASGAVAGVEKVAPAISPIFGQNPGFHLFTYDRASGALADVATRYLDDLGEAADGARAEWRQEYVFTTAYGQPAFTPAAVEAMWRGLMSDSAEAAAFRRFYTVSHGELSTQELPAYACAIGHADRESFAACFCDRP